MGLTSDESPAHAVMLVEHLVVLEFLIVGNRPLYNSCHHGSPGGRGYAVKRQGEELRGQMRCLLVGLRLSHFGTKSS